MPRRLYVFFAVIATVVVVSYVVAETFIPDVESSSPASTADTAHVDTAPSAVGTEPVVVTPSASARGWPVWVAIGAFVVAGLSLGVAGGALWVSRPAPSDGDGTGDDPGVRRAQVDAIVDVAQALVPCLHAATQYVQLVQTQTQLGDDAPDDLSARVRDARSTAEARHRDVHRAVTQGALFLPNAVLDAVYDADRVLRTLLADERAARQGGSQLVTQGMVAYYTFAATARQWAGVGELQVERLLGLSQAPDASRESTADAESASDAPSSDASDADTRDPKDSSADPS